MLAGARGEACRSADRPWLRGPASPLPLAVGADPQHVQAVAVRLEALSLCQVIDGARHALLEGGSRGDIDDLAAADAEEVVMVLGQILGQLETGEVVTGRHTADQPGDLEVDEMTVGGAARQLWEPTGYVADADRVAGAGEHLDDGPAPARVALLDAAKASFGQVVQGGGGSVS